MQKLSRIACLVTALVLSSLATADAVTPPEGKCQILCGDTIESFQSTVAQCCNELHQCSSGQFVWGTWWSYWEDLLPYDC
jgi:hypothetical protein